MVSGRQGGANRERDWISSVLQSRPRRSLGCGWGTHAEGNESPRGSCLGGGMPDLTARLRSEEPTRVARNHWWVSAEMCGLNRVERVVGFPPNHWPNSAEYTSQWSRGRYPESHGLWGRGSRRVGRYTLFQACLASLHHPDDWFSAAVTAAELLEMRESDFCGATGVRSKSFARRNRQGLRSFEL